MSTSVIGAQLYTLRDFLTTPADIAKTLKRVKQIGYDNVQVSGLGKIDPHELKRILDGEGLRCVTTHTPLDRLRNETQQVIDQHHLWGCKYTAVGGFFKKDADFTTQDWVDYIRTYNEVAAKFKGSGISIGYHNHSHEFARFDGRTAIQMLLDGFSPDVWFELDTYWITHGGGDPAAWIGRVAGRIPCVHFKDMAITPKREQLMAEVGEGNLNWPAILDACKAAGVQWYLIEQDTCQRDPFESLAISLRNVRAMGLN